MIKAVVFDMDGVLIEAKEWHYEALNRALKLFGFEISLHDHLTTYDGLPTMKKLEMLSIATGLPESLHDFINEMKQIFTMEIVHAQCKPTFVHERALSILRSKGYKLAVASNSIRNTVEVMMEKSHLDKYLHMQLSNQDVQKAKPHPDIYIKAIESFGILPCECLVVEDNPNGIAAAKGAGANLLVVDNVLDVNIDNILQRISEIEGSKK
jgi:HAD superfamily hydrolase (TIGR01509 family)